MLVLNSKKDCIYYRGIFKSHHIVLFSCYLRCTLFADSTYKFSEECVKENKQGGGGCCVNGNYGKAGGGGASASAVATSNIPKSPSAPILSHPSSTDGGVKSKLKNSIMTVQDRRYEYSVRPGYSSGASSYEGSVTDDNLDDHAGMGMGTEGGGSDDLAISRHSDILALGTLRQEMVATGDLTNTVVRIEVCSLTDRC
jgi:hypothetical protein